jgi:hypothetical protein
MEEVILKGKEKVTLTKEKSVYSKRGRVYGSKVKPCQEMEKEGYL